MYGMYDDSFLADSQIREHRAIICTSLAGVAMIFFTINFRLKSHKTVIHVSVSSPAPQPCALFFLGSAMRRVGGTHVLQHDPIKSAAVTSDSIKEASHLLHYSD
jgi:hypothetical protein